MLSLDGTQLFCVKAIWLLDMHLDHPQPFTWCTLQKLIRNLVYALNCLELP
jgi:hypothetical protein